jgi:hypothetical protein
MVNVAARDAVGASLFASLDRLGFVLGVFGLVRWSPNDWFAVAARPELVRRSEFLACGPTTCASGVRSRGRVSLGLEFGRVPGLALTAAASVATLLLAAAVAASGN